jgi:hypothetical protein
MLLNPLNLGIQPFNQGGVTLLYEVVNLCLLGSLAFIGGMTVWRKHTASTLTDLIMLGLRLSMHTPTFFCALIETANAHLYLL